jgi:hypothetical protein
VLLLQTSPSTNEPIYNPTDYNSLFYDDLTSYDSINGGGVSMVGGNGANDWSYVDSNKGTATATVSKIDGPVSGGYFSVTYRDHSQNIKFFPSSPDGGGDPNPLILTFWLRNRDYKYKGKIGYGYPTQGTGTPGNRRIVLVWTNALPNPTAVLGTYWDTNYPYDALDPVNTPEVGQSNQHFTINNDGAGFMTDAGGQHWYAPNSGRVDLIEWGEWGDNTWHRITIRWTKETGSHAGVNKDGRLEMWYDGVKVMDWIGDNPSRPEYRLVAMPGTSQRILPSFEFSGPSAPAGKWSGNSPQTVDWGKIRFFTPK